jgi:hypothetical protein
MAGDRFAPPLRGLSVAEVAERYVTATAADGTVDDRWGEDDWWIWEAMTQGIDNYGTDDERPLDPSLWSAVIIEAAARAVALPEDRQRIVSFLLGDLSIDTLAGVDATARHRFHALRSTHPGIDGIFREMQAEAEEMGLRGASPWDDDYPQRHTYPGQV